MAGFTRITPTAFLLLFLLLWSSSAQAFKIIRTDAGLVPWKARTLGQVDEMFFGDIPLSGLPKGTYFLYALVTPANNRSAYYFWSTQFTIF